ncbi:LOW QUALITY PROTEIN: clavesin-2 [Nilaparvata lugens]|uniref:LOW QUALITY PROTEIN: clavesin-2 n=1 Tax=Nilaparvata lugens TaxID=108931 RepID=UPI00193DE986|nr:LOW QUALITY PROTEIN: clavesin-2 [Nilaparvata lugens]
MVRPNKKAKNAAANIFNDSHREQQLIQALRVLVEEEENLTCSTSDTFLVRFIRASLHNLHKSHLLVKDYFRAKHESPHEFVVKSPKTFVQQLQRYDLGYPLKEVDNFGRKVLYIKLGDVDPGKESWLDLIQSMIMTLETYSLQEDVQEKGLSMILDCTNFTLKIMKWATPKMRTLMKLLQECIPIRFEVFHIVNAPLVFNIFYTTLKPFMNEEFKRKLNWHSGNLRTLDHYMDRELLPSCLGGKLEVEEIEDWYKIVLENEEFFADLRKMGYSTAT